MSWTTFMPCLMRFARKAYGLTRKSTNTTTENLAGSWIPTETASNFGSLYRRRIATLTNQRSQARNLKNQSHRPEGLSYNARDDSAEFAARLRTRISLGILGAVERTRTSTVLLPPAPQAGASASSATTALWVTQTILASRRKPRNRKAVLSLKL